METPSIPLCETCETLLPVVGFYCGSCLNQFKCKECGSYLSKEHAGCVNCGTPKETKATTSKSIQNINKFRFHEKNGEKIIEATFSDNVGAELSAMIKDTYALRLANRSLGETHNLYTNNYGNLPLDDVQHTEILETPKNDPQNARDGEYPILKAIAMKNLPSSETEWVVIYAFYASNFGKDIFIRQAIIDGYSTSNRHTKERIRDLTAYIRAAVKGNYINPLAVGYSILPKGIETAKEIICRTSSSAPKIKSSTKTKIANTEASKNSPVKKTSSRSGIPKRLTNIDFHPDGQKSLADFYQQFIVTNDYEKNLIFVFFLQDILNISSITPDHLYTCYDALDIQIPENLKSSVNNTKRNKGWIESDNKRNLTVTTKGRNKIKRWDDKS